METIKRRIKESGISRKELAKQLGIKYSLLSAYLNDFVEMPEQIREAINNIIEKEKQQ